MPRRLASMPVARPGLWSPDKSTGSRVYHDALRALTWVNSSFRRRARILGFQCWLSVWRAAASRRAMAMAAAEATGTAMSLWGRIKSQKHNILGMTMMLSFFVMSTKLLDMDKELTRVKKDHEDAQEEADELRRKVSGLKESVLREVSRAASARDSVANLKSRLQVLMEERMADMHISTASGKQQSGSTAESQQEPQQQSGKTFMV